MTCVKRFISTALCLALMLCGIPCLASENAQQRTVRVGFFESTGYHQMAVDGTMSGYGYDFLQMMLRYNNWKYQYVGYEKNWGEMLDMLENGEIDMVTLADKTPEREELFDFSDKSIGTSSTIMTVSANNPTISAGDYATYNGARVGLVAGSSHNDKFREYAAQKGFAYTEVMYENIDDLLDDLRAQENIDIAVTSNMRVVQDEVILDEFNSNEYYAVVKKGNTELLDEINSGILQLNVYSPDWRSTLFEKYYSGIHSNVISLSVSEREYLQGLKDAGVKIKAAMNPELRPYSYFENGEAKGIAPEIFAEVATRLGLDYEILPSETRWEYKQQLNGEADIDLTAYLDYSLAQRYNLKETDAYLTSAIAMLTRKDSDTNPDTMVIAALRDPTEYIGYNNELIYKYDYKDYESIAECIDAVKTKKADATFRYVYIAEQAVLQDYTNQLQYTVMPEYTFNLCIGVNNEEDHRLLSVLNKAVNSLQSSFTQGVMLEQSTNIEKSDSLIAVVYDHPGAVIGIAGAFLLMLCAGVFLLLNNRAQKSKMQFMRKMNRFIGYVCESYETVSEINLKTRIATDYYAENGNLREEKTVYKVLDRAYFAKRVPPEDVDAMTQKFSDEALTAMINEGKEKYFECRMTDGKSSEYRYKSYILKPVPRDAMHPCNYVVLKKDIEDAKASEEQQKQLLRDALATAESASAAKGQFLSRVSHEIRTPLNAVIGYMDIAKDSRDNPDKIMHCIENSDTAAKHLLAVINDVLDMSSIESGRFKIANEEFNLKTQLTNVTTMFFNRAKEKGVTFEAVLNNVTQEWLIGDALRLTQILMNLLSNAVKFTPEGGSVTLTVTQVNIDDKSVYFKFVVSDTGIGMSEEYQKRLFKPFEQESATTAQKYGGTGLGLSITNNLVHLMGGSVECQSVQNEGTAFTVSLNFARGAGHEVPQATDYSNVRVLIVDDDEAACEYMQQLFKRCGVKCDTVQSGKAAVRRVKGRMNSDYAYNMCLIDWNMPEMNGIETARKIHDECDAQLPIIIATAYDVTQFADEAAALGVKKIIAKPLFQSSMFDLLVQTFGKYTPAPQTEKTPVGIAGLRVILAEDNAMNMEIATAILEKAGIVITPVTDGKQALDTFVQSPAGSFDAILMDVQMPVMDGYAATEAIRKSTHPEAKTMPIIAMTANAFAEDVNAALACGMNGHISKPVDYDKLYNVLNKYCNKGEK